jgi:hypothetical protein
MASSGIRKNRRAVAVAATAATTLTRTIIPTQKAKGTLTQIKPARRSIPFAA